MTNRAVRVNQYAEIVNQYVSQPIPGYPQDTPVFFGHFNLFCQQFLGDKQQLVILKALICALILTTWNIWMGCICVLHRLDMSKLNYQTQEWSIRFQSMVGPHPQLLSVRFLLL